MTHNWTRALVFALTLLGPNISSGWADDGIRGIWHGTYTCDQPQGTLTLTIDEFAKGRFSGALHFSVDATQGSYRVTGTVDRAGAFRLQPRAWIVQPQGFRSLSMWGKITADGTRIEGTLPGCGKSAFGIALTARLPAPQEGQTTSVPPEPRQDRAGSGPQVRNDAPSQEGSAWADRVRASIAALVQAGEITWRPWERIEKEIMSNAPPDMEGGRLIELRLALMSEMRAGQAQIHSDRAGRIRAQIAELIAAGDATAASWERIRSDIARTPVGPQRLLDEALMREWREGPPQVKANAWLAEWASTVTRSEDDELKHALAGLARTGTIGWPERVTARIREAMRARIAAALRPLLSETALLLPGLTNTLDSIVRVRAALAPLRSSHARLVAAYGTIDPEGILGPLWARIAEIERVPGVAEELRLAWAEARSLSNPRWETEQVINRVFGPDPTSSSLSPMIANARELANVAAIVVQDKSTKAADPHEPNAWNIAAFVHTRAIRINAEVARREKQCSTGRYRDPIQALECLPYVSTGQLVGGLRGRVARVEKHGCAVETPGVEFRCSFLQHIEFVSAAGGPLAPDMTDRLVRNYFPGGYQGEVSTALFRRTGREGEEGWKVTWESRPVAASAAQSGSISCPYGEYDAGGFCFPFNAFGRW